MNLSLEFVNVIKRFKDEQIDELYQNQGVVISVFRYISPLSKQFILRLIKLGNRKFTLKNWTLDVNQNKFAQDSQIELKSFRIMRSINSNDHENLTLNEYFAKTLQKTFLNGYQPNFLEAKNLSEKEPQKFKDEMKEYSRKNWRKLHEVIVGGSEPMINENSHNYQVLIKSELCRTSSFFGGKITEKGFHFILNTTSNQINTFLSEYCNFLIHKNIWPAIKIISFIFDLSLLIPHQTYFRKHKDGTSFLDYEKIILDDFCELGLIWRDTYNGNIFHTTPLLWNFVYEKEQKDLDFTADIIVETNFKVYAYSVSDFILKLLEHFCEIRYRLPNLIIAELTIESVHKAFKNNITAAQLTEFLNKNINPQKIKLMSENTQKKQNSELTEEDKKKPLEYLRLFSRERPAENEYTIPDNIIQQLKLWENEKNLEYSDKAIDAVKKLG